MDNDQANLPQRADLVVGSTTRSATRSSTTDDGATRTATIGSAIEPSPGAGAPLLRGQLAESVLSELSHVLSQQRDLVTQMIYRLEVQQIMLARGRTRWVNLSTEDVEDAIQAVQDQEVVRMALVGDLAPLMGTPIDASLRDLIVCAPDPWDTILSDHHTEFLRLSAEAEDAATANADLLHTQLTDVRSLLQSFGSQSEQSYGARSNGFSSAPASAVLVDREA